jgi:hypothetical protein
MTGSPVPLEVAGTLPGGRRVQSASGFTGLRKTSTIDTDELPAEMTTEALKTLETLASGPPPGPSTLPRYRLTLHYPSGDHVVELTEPHVPPSLRPLLAELERRARAGS